MIDTLIFEDDIYLIKLCVAVFICLSETVKEKDIDGITNAINNLHLHIKTPEKILKEADKLKISANKISDIKATCKGRSSMF